MLASIRSRCPWLPAAALLAAALAVLPAALAATTSPAMAYKAKTLKVKNADWCAAWWQWFLSIPEAVNPAYDDTGANASVGQRGPVWFLCGAFNESGTVTRNITVPEGTYLFFPILGYRLDNGDPAFPPETEEALRAILADYVTDPLNIDPASLSCTVAGAGVTDLAKRRVVSTAFKYVVAPGTAVEIGTAADPNDVVSPAVSDGYWVMLKPLPVGTHTIAWSGTDTFGTQSVTYVVHVEAPTY